MQVIVNQTIKKCIITANQLTRKVLVTISPFVKKSTIIVEQLGKRGFTGLSNYDVAVKNGFVGTETQWLLSLKPSIESITNEVPSGALNGINATFTSLNSFKPETLTIYLNGILQKINLDYNTIENNTVLLNFSPNSNENISINYIKI